MGSSYISFYAPSEKKALKEELWLHDSYASILSFMLGIEILTDETLGDWAAPAGRELLLAAIYGGTGAINPGLYRHRNSPDQVKALHDALVRVKDKLCAYGGIFPGRYWREHNMLLPGEQMPPDMPIGDLFPAIDTLIAEAQEIEDGMDPLTR